MVDMKKFTSPAVGQVAVQDSFFAPRIEANHKATIPASLKFSRDSGRIDAFKLNWKPGMPKQPHIFWDSDVAKVVEGMAYDLVLNPGDKKLARELDKIVALIVSAQQPDGYLNTHFTTADQDKRFKGLHWDHELYCCGHLIEAAIAHFQATGKRNFLDCMCRYADYVASVFGRGKGKLRGYPGHEEIELALCRLSEATGEKKYFNLAQYFIEERGRKPNYYVEKENINAQDLINLQADKTVRERTDAVGHAVRMMYLSCGVADVAARTDDAELLARCADITRSVAQKRMFVTGGIGSTIHGEAFENDYKLVNLLAYAESCASMGLVWFMQRMHNATGDGAYIDILERALYNGALAGISLSGDHFFYRNPLRSSVDSPYIRERVGWFDCSCCSTNYCRFLPQIGSFLWSESATEVRLNIPSASTFRSGDRALQVTGGYPYKGAVTVRFLADGEYTFAFRVPGWCRRYTVKVNGSPIFTMPESGYVKITRAWRKGDKIDIRLAMAVEVMRANPAVDDDAGKVAIQRGPLVYALESVDNGPLLHNIALVDDGVFRTGPAKDLPEGTVAISGHAVETIRPGNELYSAAKPTVKKRSFTAIPFALWQNRGLSEMEVWVREWPATTREPRPDRG